MPTLTLSLLGSPVVELDGRPIEVDTRKAIALLAYLAVSGQSHRREALAVLLWPEYDEPSARASLRRTLSALKSALADAWLVIGRDSIGLKREAGLWLDVDEFRQRLRAVEAHGHDRAEACRTCVTALRQAAELYRGDFLAGFAVRESPNFDEWQLFQADALTRELAGVLERLVSALSATHEFQQAIMYARRWLALDPLHEPAHRQLMLLYAWSGERAAALRQYRDCVRVLDQELGVAPLAETTALAEAIKEDRVPGPPVSSSPPPPVSPSPRPPVSPSPRPLVGRDAEWAALERAYEQAEQGYLVVVEGEAGIGKTRLAEDFLAQARSRGAVAIAGRCYEGEARLAYLPFVEALRPVLAGGEPTWLGSVPEHWLSEAARLLPELAALRPSLSQAGPLESPGAHTRFLEALAQLIFVPAGNGKLPGILFLDDVHWADEASLELLGYLVRRLAGRRLLVVLTWRSEEVPPGHRLRALLAAAERAGRGSDLHLSRLGLDDVRRLVHASADDTSGGAELPEVLYRETDGLPFFLVEYLEAMAGSEIGLGEELPRGVRELLRSRLARVGETGMQLMTTAAVIGRSFDFETAREASGRSEEEAVAALEELMRAGLIREIDDTPGQPGFDFSHERLRDLVYGEASLVRRRLLHRRVADALRTRRRSPASAQAGQIAHHYHQAGQHAEAAEYFKQAAEQARAVYANPQALAHFEMALALGHPDPVRLHEAIGDLQTLGGDYGAARASYELAASDSTRVDLGRLEHKLGNLYRRQGDWDLAASHFHAALAAFDEAGSAAERARLFADWSLVAQRQGEGERANALAEEALALAEQAGDRQALAEAHNILGILASSRGDQDVARGHLERSLALAESLGEPSVRVAALNNLALLSRATGQLDEGIALTEAALSLCAVQGDRHRQAALHNNLADLLHAAGRRDDAMQQLKQAVSIFAEIGAEPRAMQPEIWKLTEW